MNSSQVEADRKRQAVGSLFLVFTATKLDPATLEAYLQALGDFTSGTVVEACKRLREAWKSQSAPRPAHIREYAAKVAREIWLAKRGGDSTPSTRPQAKAIGDAAARIEFLRSALAGVPEERAADLVFETSGMTFGSFLCSVQGLARDNHLDNSGLLAGHLWQAWDEYQSAPTEEF